MSPGLAYVLLNLLNYNVPDHYTVLSQATVFAPCSQFPHDPTPMNPRHLDVRTKTFQRIIYNTLPNMLQCTSNCGQTEKQSDENYKL